MIIKCANCQEYIELPDDAGGKTLPCVLCGIAMMVPRPHAPDDDADLDFRPVDEAEEKRAKAVLDEMHRRAVAQIGTDVSKILRSEKVPDKTAPNYVDPAGDDIEGLVIDWLLFEHAGDDGEATIAVSKMRGRESDVKSVLARLTLGILDGTSLAELDPEVFAKMKQKLRVKLDSAGLVGEGEWGRK